MAYIIYSDLAADIAPEYARENGIRFIPMRYSLGGEDRLCSAMEPEEVLHRFYEGQRKGDLTQTSQIPPQVYVDAFTPVLEQGDSVLYLSLSSGLSNTYNSSRVAAQELNDRFGPGRVACVDSLGATGGMGLLLEWAVENRRAGMSLEENAAWLEKNRLRVCHLFMVEDLLYLKRGGRVSAATAVVGTALNIKPILRIQGDGTLKNFAKARGGKNAMLEMLRIYDRTSDRDGRVIILHADSPEKAAFLEGEIRSRDPKCRITVLMLSPIIGAHTGPGMCALVYSGAREEG